MLRFSNFHAVRVERDDLRAGNAVFCLVTMLENGQGLIVHPSSIQRGEEPDNAWINHSAYECAMYESSERSRLIQEHQEREKRAAARREQEVMNDLRERERWKEERDRDKAIRDSRLSLGDSAEDAGKCWKLPFSASVARGGSKVWTQYVYVGKSLCRDGRFPVWAVMQSCDKLAFRHRVVMCGYGLTIEAGGGQAASLYRTI